MYGDYLIEGDRMELDEDEDKDGEKNKYLEDNEKDRTKELWELDLWQGWSNLKGWVSICLMERRLEGVIQEQGGLLRRVKEKGVWQPRGPVMWWSQDGLESLT